MNKTALTLVVGANEILTATVLPEDTDDKTVTFTSSAPTVATVTPKQGNVVGKAAGIAIVTGTTANGLTVTCEVTVISAE